MIKHFSHYLSQNQKKSSQDEIIDFDFEFEEEEVNQDKENESFANISTIVSDIDDGSNELTLKDKISELQNDTDDLFIVQLIKDLRSLSPQSKSLFKVKSQALLHSMKYKST